MDELEKLEAKLKQTKARIQKIKSRERDKQRKLDTRKKILLGAGLLTFENTPEAKVLIPKIIAAMDERNRALFDDDMEKK